MPLKKILYFAKYFELDWATWWVFTQNGTLFLGIKDFKSLKWTKLETMCASLLKHNCLHVGKLRFLEEKKYSAERSFRLKKVPWTLNILNALYFEIWLTILCFRRANCPKSKTCKELYSCLLKICVWAVKIGAAFKEREICVSLFWAKIIVELFSWAELKDVKKANKTKKRKNILAAFLNSKKEIETIWNGNDTIVEFPCTEMTKIQTYFVTGESEQAEEFWPKSLENAAWKSHCNGCLVTWSYLCTMLMSFWDSMEVKTSASVEQKKRMISTVGDGLFVSLGNGIAWAGKEGNWRRKTLRGLYLFWVRPSWQEVKWLMGFPM